MPEEKTGAARGDSLCQPYLPLLQIGGEGRGEEVSSTFSTFFRASSDSPAGFQRPSVRFSFSISALLPMFSTRMVSWARRRLVLGQKVGRARRSVASRVICLSCWRLLYSLCGYAGSFNL